MVYDALKKLREKSAEQAQRDEIDKWSKQDLEKVAEKKK